jgi:uncharacterized protein (DUF2236 family)
MQHAVRVRERLRAAGVTRPGPGSVTWTINREVIVLAGWGRAILLQLGHPAIAAALGAHSSFRTGVLSRLRRIRSTVGAMLSITFGGTEDMIAAAARINTIHDHVRGDGYSAHDPELQRWVHATLLDSVPSVYERLVGALSSEQRDQYCLESAMMEPLLGLPAGSLPRDRAQLDAYMRSVFAGGTLEVTETSRALARAVLYPPGWCVAWPVFRPLQLLTIGSLPPAIRAAYGFEWRTQDARALLRWTGALRILIRALPAAARHWPAARRRIVPVQPMMARAH